MGWPSTIALIIISVVLFFFAFIEKTTLFNSFMVLGWQYILI